MKERKEKSSDNFCQRKRKKINILLSARFDRSARGGDGGDCRKVKVSALITDTRLLFDSGPEVRRDSGRPGHGPWILDKGLQRGPGRLQHHLHRSHSGGH